MKITDFLNSIFFGSPESREKAQYLQEVNEWKNQGLEGEDRAQAISQFNAFIKNPKKTELFFWGCGLKTLPPLGFIAERIKILSLESNQLRELPESLGELHNLKVIHLGKNQIQEIPEWFGRELHNLEVLWVSHNPDLKEIPPSLLDSPNFTWLDATGTQITKTLKELREERQEDRAVIAFNLLLTRGVQPRLPENFVSQVNHFIKEPSR